MAHMELLDTLISASVRGGVVLAVVAVAAALVPAHRASLRHFLWALALAELALLTLLVPIVPTWQTSVLPPSPLNSLTSAPATIVAIAGIAGATTASVPGSAVPAATEVGMNWRLVLLGIWLAGTAVLLLRRWGSWRRARAALRAARPVADTRLYKCLADKVHAFGLARVPELRWSPAVFVPVVVGIRRPVLLVPADASTWSDALLDAVFSHELAHVQRHDLLVQLGADVVRAFHWPNPLAWVAAARLHIERERAADDCVLAGGAKSSDYASHLLRLAEHARGQLALGAGAAMLGRSQLRQRLERLLRPRLGGKPGLGRAFVGRRTAVLLVFVAMTAALPVACLESAGTPGGAPARFVYQVDPAHADATAAVLARRLDALALEGVRITKAGDRLTVDVPLLPTARRAEVDRVLASSARLRLALVDSGAEYSRKLAAHVRSDVTAARAGITVEEEEWRRGEGGASFHDVYLVGPRAALAAYLRALPESLRPPSGRTLLFDQTKDPERQRTVLIDDSTAVTITRVADADVFAFGGSDGWFEVNVALDAADGARLEALTSANLGRRMAVIFDEADLWGEPMVQSPIGTRVSVTARGSRDEAEQLAAGFRAGGLPAPLQRIADR